MKTVAIVVGHNHLTGARACDGTDEWAWNSHLANTLKNELVGRGYAVVQLHRDKSLGYSSGMRKLGKQMKEARVDIALSLHFNSATASAHGFEFLYWWGSAKSKLLAECMGQSYKWTFPQLAKRGSGHGERSLWFHKWNEDKGYSRRGAGFCFLTPCPAVICEPFFASNPREWALMKGKIVAAAKAYADGVDAYDLKQRLK